jgi:hypothetical protein
MRVSGTAHSEPRHARGGLGTSPAHRPLTGCLLSNRAVRIATVAPLGAKARRTIGDSGRRSGRHRRLGRRPADSRTHDVFGEGAETGTHRC